MLQTKSPSLRGWIGPFFIIPAIGFLVFYSTLLLVSAPHFYLLRFLANIPGLTDFVFADALAVLLLMSPIWLATLVAVGLYKLKKVPFDSTLLTCVAVLIAVGGISVQRINLESGSVVTAIVELAIFVASFYLANTLLKISPTYRSGGRVAFGNKMVRRFVLVLLVVASFYGPPMVMSELREAGYDKEVRNDVSQITYKVFMPTWIPKGMTYNKRFYNEAYDSPEDLVLFTDIVGKTPFNDVHESLELCQSGREDFTASDGARCPDNCFSFVHDKLSLSGVCFPVGTTAKGDQVYGVRHPQAGGGADFWIVRVGGTLIGLDPININHTWDPDSTIVTDADILKIVGSLVEISKDQIKLR